MTSTFAFKSLTLALVAFAVAASIAEPSIARAQAPTKIPALYKKAYVPFGFDDNDQVQIVGEGMFKNTCYRASETTVKVDEASHVITVSPTAYEYKGMCAQMVLPFDRVVELGVLSVGDWSIVQIDGSQIGHVQIAKALTKSPDDYLYAPISQAFFHQKDKTSEFILDGNFPNSCMAIDHVKITAQNDVIVIQPIAKMLDRSADGSACHDGSFHFDSVSKLDNVAAGRYLMHVRSMNGKAVNSLVDVRE
jgi:hypothetical protein